MTAYLVRWNQATAVSGNSIAIRAVTYELRISQVNFWSWGGSGVYQIFRHETSTLSGGTSTPVVPLRQGAPAATCTASTGVLTTSGTRRVLGSAYLPPGSQSSPVGASVITTYPGSTAQIQPPLTLTVLPGSVFRVGGPTFAMQPTVGCEIYFEELRLTGSS